MKQCVQVKIGEFGGVGYFEVDQFPCKRDDWVILQADRNKEYGWVISDHAKEVPDDEQFQGKVLRVAHEGDLKQIAQNQIKAKEAVKTCLQRIKERKLEMNIIKSEYTFDVSKIIFLFSAEGRVDFRALVKDLAKIYKVRIELRQIGVRDKAKIVGGYGICGREQCCASYMKGFHALSIKMAKEQNLPLNPSKIGGICGRIKCCMAYEFAVYKECSRNLPRIGEKITTPDGRGRVIDVDVLKKKVSVDLGEGKSTKVIYN